MELRYTLTRKDFLWIRKQTRKDGGKSKASGYLAKAMIFLGAAGSMGAGITTLLAHTVGNPGLPAFLWVLPIFIFLIPGITLLADGPAFKTRRELRQREKCGGYFGQHTIRLEEAELVLSWGGSLCRLPCWGLRTEGGPGGWTLILAGQTTVEYLPPAAFAGREQRDAFCLGLLENARKAGAAAEENIGFELAFVWEPQAFEDALVEGNRILLSGPEYWTAGRIVRTIITLPLGLLGLAVPIIAILHNPSGGLSALSGSMLLFALGFGCNIGLITRFFLRSIVRRQIRTGVVSADAFLPQRSVLSEQGCFWYTSNGSKRYLWPQITRCERRMRGLYLIAEQNWLLIIPSGAFENLAEQERVESYIRRHMQTAANSLGATADC